MIKDNIAEILHELPSGVELEAAAKGRTPAEIQQAADAGIKIIGENYVQEAQNAFNIIGNKVKWHFIGHLQKNKIKKSVDIFDMIETVDSLKLAEGIDEQCHKKGKIMPVLIEINSGEEKQKFGVSPQDAQTLIEKISKLSNIKITGIMTMGPMTGNPEDSRQYFKTTKKIFEEMKALNLPNVEMQYLSMGMSNTYKVAIEEGANIVRIGTGIFGERNI